MRYVGLSICKQILQARSSLAFLSQVRSLNNLPAPESKTSVVPIKRDPFPQARIKHFRVEYHGIEESKFNDETIWIPIYQFPFIRSCRAFIRFKVYLTFLSSLACISDVALHLLSNSGFLPNALAVSGLTLFTMTVAGNFCRKLVVQIYASEDNEILRFCRFTFFGKRIDLVLPVAQVLPLSETNSTWRKIVLTLVLVRPQKVDLKYDSYEFYDGNLKMSLRYGGILDQERFKRALGDLMSRKHYM